MDDVNILNLTELYGKEVDPNYVPVKPEVCSGCTDCCSDEVPFTLAELDKFSNMHPELVKSKEFEYIMDNTSAYIKNDGKCVFLKDELCVIYEQRPDICRAYGSSPLAQCGMEGIGYTPNAGERSERAGPAHQRASENMMKVFFAVLKEKQRLELESIKGRGNGGSK